MDAMKVIVDFDRCESNAVCMGVAPEVFEVRDDDYLYILDENPAESLRPTHRSPAADWDGTPSPRFPETSQTPRSSLWRLRLSPVLVRCSPLCC